MKIKEQTRKLAAGCSKHRFEVVNRTDEVSSKHCFEVVDRTDEVSSKHCFEVVDRTDEVSNHIYGKATLTRFEEIFEEYKNPQDTFFYPLVYKENTYEKNCYFYLCSPSIRS
ncbi:hypothetical protein [Streptococcus pseudopneumoniae]|uniref:hypothetical protein n=2 Tax=Streptococcus pseudopneumoniae TaxID=257758 RepID=UPI001FBBAA8E|nr:hypothetical protein [Streptococcus pseudopneumoniae]